MNQPEPSDRKLTEPGPIRAVHCQVQRTARYYVAEPVEPPTEIVLAVHGYAQSAEAFLWEVRPALGPSQILVAPEGLSRFYRRGVEGEVVASWMTREDRLFEIEDHCRFLDQVWHLVTSPFRDPSVRVIGFSQGVATVTRWLARSAFPVRQLILWAGSIPQDGTMEALGERFDGRLDLVYGNQDPVAKPPEPNLLHPLLDPGRAEVFTHLFTGGHHLDQVLLRRLLES